MGDGRNNGATTTFTKRTTIPPPEGLRQGDDKRYLSHTPLHNNEVVLETTGSMVSPQHATAVEHTGSRDHWTSFNDMVEKSQREMEDMMRRHSLKSGDQPTSPPSMSTRLELSQPATILSQPPAGVSTSRDVTTSGKNVTQREEKRWDDQPAPGVTRTNRVLNENTDLKGADGSTVGNKKRLEQESKAEGSNEQTLPDGTKQKTFTKSYETRNVYSFNSSDPKAV